MQIICISRRHCSEGNELAEALARKLGCRCLSREDLVEKATEAGIAVGKLEAAMLRPERFGERLLLEKEQYHAFVTASLCEIALKSDLVYHGRTGHLLLPGIPNVLRIRVDNDLEKRIELAMNQLRVSRAKASRYLQEVDDDLRRWVRVFYNVEYDTAAHYDFVVNLDQLSLASAAAALCSMAQLPDFQTTPASRRAMEDLHLAARVRLELARDEQTGNAPFRVTADGGSVLVTYLPRDARVAEFVPRVVQRVGGVDAVRCTMAATNILWIQEEFDAAAESYAHVVELARRWNAAVEMLRFVSSRDDETPATPVAVETRPEKISATREYNGGIEDDVEEPPTADDGGLREIHDSLGRDGVAGGARTVCCSARNLRESLDNRVQYTLVVVGDVFLAQDRPARTRMTRDLGRILAETLKVPVVGVDELKKTYLFTKGQAVRLFLQLAAAAGIVGAVMTNQGAVLRFLQAEGNWSRLMAAAFVALLVPCFAYLYGSLTKGLLRLIRIE